MKKFFKEQQQKKTYEYFFFCFCLGQRIWVEAREFFWYRQLRFWNSRTHWFGHKVWSNYWYLWFGLLCGVGKTRLQCSLQKEEERNCWFQTQALQRRSYEMVSTKGMTSLLYLFMWSLHSIGRVCILCVAVLLFINCAIVIFYATH